MQTPLFSLLFFSSLFFSSLISPSLSAELCNPNDKKVLLQIKESLNNPYLLASWTNNSDCCVDWYLVACDSTTNRINSLTLFSGNISGQIPSAVGDLPYLETLEFLQLTHLYGEIPSAISKLKSLTFVRLSYTNLTGPVPSFFSQLKNLTFLDLSYNDLSGSVPGSLSSLQNLNALRLDGNKLTGSIPTSFGEFSGNVPDLYLSYNQLSGKIPTSLGNMNWGTIDLSFNKLTGDASMLFGTNKSTQFIILSNNLLAFDLTNVKFPSGLTNLDISHNKITGSLPEGLTSLNLQLLNVSYNQLCGQIPTGGKLQTFDEYSYFHNKCLCGAPLPAC